MRLYKQLLGEEGADRRVERRVLQGSPQTCRVRRIFDGARLSQHHLEREAVVGHREGTQHRRPHRDGRPRDVKAPVLRDRRQLPVPVAARVLLRQLQVEGEFLRILFRFFGQALPSLSLEWRALFRLLPKEDGFAELVSLCHECGTTWLFLRLNSCC